MSEEKFDDRYVGFREHAAAMQRADAELARLRERQATTEAALLHEVAAVRTDIGEMKQILLRQPAAAVDHNALVTHRALDAMTQAAERLSGPSNTQRSPVLLSLAILGAGAVGAFIWQFIGG